MGSETTNFDFYLCERTPRGRRMGESPWFAGSVTQAMGSGAGLRRSRVWPALCWLGRWMEFGEWGGWLEGEDTQMSCSN